MFSLDTMSNPARLKKKTNLLKFFQDMIGKNVFYSFYKIKIKYFVVKY